jgi:ribosome-associated heat shock protein Hsp15
MARRAAKPEQDAGTASPGGTMRLDKWIWFARFQRTREACADLVRKGHVRLDGRKVAQPGASVRVGRVLTLALPGRTVIVEVLDLAERRESAEAAGVLYRTIEPGDRVSGKND